MRARTSTPSSRRPCAAASTSSSCARSRSRTEPCSVLEEARTITRRLGVPLVVNDRPDLAVLVGADYIHVGQDDLPTAAAGRFGLPVGLSTHSPAELDRAEADYIGVGPVYATPTKEGRPAVGLELVAAAEHARMPWFAIGGRRVATWSAPGRLGSRSCVRSGTRTIPSRRRGSSAWRS